MSRFALALATLSLLCALPQAAHSQPVSSRVKLVPTDTGSSLPGAEATPDSLPGVRADSSASRWLGQAGLKLADGTNTALSVEVYKYWLGLGDSLEVPFVVLGQLPTLGRRNRADVLGSVLDEYGGSLNIALSLRSRRLSIGRFLEWPDTSPFGLWVTARGAAKLVDVNAAAEEKGSDLTVLALGSFHASLLLPIWRHEHRRSVNDRAGSIQGELTASFQWSENDDYRRIVSTEDPIDSVLFYMNGNVSLILTDFFYATAAFTIHVDDDRLDRMTTFGFKYLTPSE